MTTLPESLLALLALAPVDPPAAAQQLAPLELAGVVIAPLRPEVALESVTVGKRAAVRVKGGDLGVAITPQTLEHRSLIFGVRHRDLGDHGFVVAFDTGEGHAAGGFQCNAKGKGAVVPGTGEGHAPGAAVEFRCNSFVPGTGEGHAPGAAVEYRCNSFVPGTGEGHTAGGTGEGHGSLVVSPSFADAKSYSLRATQHGKLVIDRAGLTGAFTIEDFEGLEEQKLETLQVQVAYGAVRDDAWSITVRHEGWVVTVTPDAAQRFDGLPTVALTTSGLDEAVLTGVCSRAEVGKPALSGCPAAQ